MLNRNRTFQIIYLGAILLTLAGCGGSAHSPTENYTLIATNIKIPYWQSAAAGLKQAATELGVRYEMVGPENYNPQGQHEEFRRVLGRQAKPSGILVSASDAELLKGDIDAAIDLGIPVIAIDSDSPGSKRLFFIGTDNYRAGLTGGEIAAKRMQGKGNVVILTIPGQANLAQRLRGYQDAFASRPQIKIVETIDMKGDPSLAFDATKEIVTGGKIKADAFVCLEAQGCTEVAEVLERNNITDKVVIAMDTDEDTLQRLKKGSITATIAQKPFTMSYVGLKMLDLLHHNKPASLTANWAQDAHSPVPSAVDTGATLVTPENVDAFLAQAAPAAKK
ncbi:MAG: substrate-binding domain-containing protein [Bryobacteraceae bacterium]